MNTKTKKLVLCAVLVAVMLLFAFTPIGIISIPPANATIMHIPVIIGTILLGLKPGLILGGCFGLTSVFVAFTRPSVLVQPMMAESPALVIVMSLAARLLIPVITWLVYRLLSTRFPDRQKTSVGVSALCGTVINTVCYLGLMLCFYTLLGLDSAAVKGVIAGVGLLNGSIEAGVAVVLSIPLVTALRKTFKRELHT